MSATTTAPIECKAQLLADGWECEKCALAWDDGDKAPSCQPLTFKRLHDAAIDEAERIEGSQRALVASEMRKHRYQQALSRAQELRALARMVLKHTGNRND